MSAMRDDQVRAIVGDALESEASALAEIVAKAKVAGAIDSVLDTDAIVLLCQGVSVGSHLMMRVQAERRGHPSDHDMNLLVSRLFSALMPLSRNGPAASS